MLYQSEDVIIAAEQLALQYDEASLEILHADVLKDLDRARDESIEANPWPLYKNQDVPHVALEDYSEKCETFETTIRKHEIIVEARLIRHRRNLRAS